MGNRKNYTQSELSTDQVLGSIAGLFDMYSAPVRAAAATLMGVGTKEDATGAIFNLLGGSNISPELLSFLRVQKAEPKIYPSFSELLERKGMEKLGSLSELIPSRFSATGNEPYMLQKGGPLDITGRGALGTILDLGSDLLVNKGLGLISKEFSGAKTLIEEGKKQTERLGLMDKAKIEEELKNIYTQIRENNIKAMEVRSELRKAIRKQEQIKKIKQELKEISSKPKNERQISPELYDRIEGVYTEEIDHLKEVLKREPPERKIPTRLETLKELIKDDLEQLGTNYKAIMKDSRSYSIPRRIVVDTIRKNEKE